MTNPIECRSSAVVMNPAQAHVISRSNMIGVLVGLLVLTVATVAGTYIDMGSTVNVWLAFSIAVAQASLVALYFMRLRWDSSFNGVILVTAMFFMALFIGIAVLDTKEYHSSLAPPAGVAPQP